MNAAASAANPLTADITDQPPWSEDMTNQGNRFSYAKKPGRTQPLTSTDTNNFT
jgi:hypothetical protein